MVRRDHSTVRERKQSRIDREKHTLVRDFILEALARRIFTLTLKAQASLDIPSSAEPEPKVSIFLVRSLIHAPAASETAPEKMPGVESKVPSSPAAPSEKANYLRKTNEAKKSFIISLSLPGHQP